jgi:hypothetical protein
VRGNLELICVGCKQTFRFDEPSFTSARAAISSRGTSRHHHSTTSLLFDVTSLVGLLSQGI